MVTGCTAGAGAAGQQALDVDTDECFMSAAAAPSHRQSHTQPGPVLQVAVAVTVTPEHSAGRSAGKCWEHLGGGSWCPAVGWLGRDRVTGPHSTLKSNAVVTEVHRPGARPSPSAEEMRLRAGWLA